MLLQLCIIPNKCATFQIKKAKLYLPIIILSINDNIKFLENIKAAFKRTISWNKYRFKITTQTKTIITIILLIQPLGALIDSLFFHSIMVITFLREVIWINTTLQLVEIKDFNP